MRSKAIFMALLALVFGARAATVSQEDAKVAALGWAVEGGHLGVRMGSIVESAATHVTTNGATFHSVKMFGGGTVFMSGDDEFPPVIAFTGDTLDYSKIDRKSPLWALLSRDATMRRAAKEQTPQVIAAVGEAYSTANSEWAVLRARGAAFTGIVRALYSAPRYNAPGDLRVDQLLKSTWDQAEAGGNVNKLDSATCYNYYTPQDDSGTIYEGKKENAVCGCVATAMSQIMYFHKYPAAATVPEVPDTCWFDNTELNLPVSGQPYEWSLMEDSPTQSSSEETRKAIGLLTSDAGRAVGMAYSSGESGSFTFKAAKMMGDVFNYGQSVCVMNNTTFSSVGSLTEKRTIGKVIFSNLDAGYPVILGVSGDGGHEICADGYGYHNQTPYVHLNMGWSGSCDIWYNLPEITCSASMSFNSVDDAVYNMIPDGAGKGIVSGRVVDEEGKAVDGAIVSVYDAGTLVTQLVTSVYGVWGVALPEGTYDVSVSDTEGMRSGEANGILVKAPVMEEKEIRWASSAPQGYESGKWPLVANKEGLGNSWGNDVELRYPRIRIVTSAGETNIYSSLDRAITGARTLAAAGETPELEILRPVDLNEDAVIDFNCTLRAATGDESSTLVVRPSGAVISVSAGATFVASNCVFGAGTRAPIQVLSGGKVVVGAGFSAERVISEDATGFNVAGFITSDLTVECSVATDIGHVFGFAETDDPAALSNSVSRIVASFDEEGEIRGRLEEISPGVYRLVWGEASVPLQSAVGYYVTADGATNASAQVDRLFARYENALAAGLFAGTPEIVLIGRDTRGMSRDLVVSSELVIRGMADAFLAPTEYAHIIVTNGGSLTVKDVVAGDRSGDTFIRVLEGGSLTLGAGAKLSALECTGNDDRSKAGPVAVLSGGRLRIEQGAAIENCSAVGSSLGGQHGGGVYLCAGAVLDLAGGAITGCSSKNGFGGGVYAELGADVVVSGPSRVVGNVNKNEKADDIYIHFSEAEKDVISVVGSAAGGEIGVRYSTSDGNAAGSVFATAQALSSAHDIDASAEAFFNDASDARIAVASGSDIMWESVDDAADGGLEPIDQNDASAMAYAVAKVDYPAAFTEYGQTAFWRSVQEAFASLEEAAGDATVTLLQDDWFDADIAVNCNVTFVSEGGADFELSRLGSCSIVVNEEASLVVGDIICSDVRILGNVSQKPLFDVAGGRLILDGAQIADISADGSFGAAITAYAGAFVELRNDAEILRCKNIHSRDYIAKPFSGAILVSDSGTSLVLGNCTVSGCVADYIGGVCAVNGAVVEISGTTEIDGNETGDGNPANLVVAQSSDLALTGELTGTVGVMRDVATDLAVFGRVDESFQGDDDVIAASAMRFVSDEGRGYGIPVRSESGQTLLAWGEKLSPDGSWTDGDGVVYSVVVAPSERYVVEVPTAAAGLVYNGLEQTGVVSRLGYDLSGEFSATNAGTYSVTATLREGYVWSDDTDEVKTVNWTIAKSEYDMNGVSFSDAVLIFDGKPKTLEISGELPAGVTVAYFGNSWTMPGEYTVTASFKTDEENYQPLPDMTATMTILRAVKKPVPAALVYNALEQIGVPECGHYTLSGDVSGIDAGTNYTAVATLDEYCVWDDEDYSSEPLEIEWSISPAKLTVTATPASKVVGLSDPACFAYTVEGLQGADAAADVLTGALTRDEGEALGAYAIRQGTLAVAEDEPNYEIGSYVLAFFRVVSADSSSGILPELPDGATAADVAAALDEAGLADDSVADAINGADDPVAQYNDFAEWAESVVGGEEAVAASEHALDSYMLGVTELFENEPVITITEFEIENPADASMRVIVRVTDGGVEKAVDAESVAKLFEISGDLATWTRDVTVTVNADGSYTVKPADPTLTSAFIRIAY